MTLKENNFIYLEMTILFFLNSLMGHALQGLEVSQFFDIIRKELYSSYNCSILYYKFYS